MKRDSGTLLPPSDGDYSILALRPVLITGLVTPVEGGDGGINIDLVEDPDGILVSVDPWLRMQEGDLVEFYWDDTRVDSHTVVADDIDKRIGFTLHTDWDMPDWAERVFYRLTRTGTNTPEDSVPLRLRVKLDRPGGVDQDPHKPGHSELKAPELPEDIVNNGVDKNSAAAGIPVTIRNYPGRKARDTVELQWGTVSLRRQITETEAGGEEPIVITVDQDAILAAGNDPALLVHYQVYDEVWNFSEDWSLPTCVKVDAGAWTLPAPIIEEAFNGVIDLGDLGSADVTVVINITVGPFHIGDTVTMTWLGTPITGAPVTHSQTVTVSNIPSIYYTTVPNALVRDLLGGAAKASYVLNKASGEMPQSSKVAIARITGVAPLKIPRILELIGDVLDPFEERVHVEIPVYVGMANGDLIELIWLGTRVNGTPYLYETQHFVTANDVGNVVYIPVMGEHIALLENGTLDVSYRVFNDVSTVRVSEHLLVKVGQHLAELPAPSILEAPGGELDPELNPGADVTLQVSYNGTVAGDTLTWYWLGHPLEGSGSDWLPITTAIAGKPVDFKVRRPLVDANINNVVRVLYTLKRGATGHFQYSKTLDLVIGKPIGELPAPTVLEASNGVLDPIKAQAGVTVQVDYKSVQPKDTVTMMWLGSPGAGSPADQEQTVSENGPVNFMVPATVVGANIGRGVSVSYRVKRYMAEQQSIALMLSVLPFGDPDKDLPHPAITQADGQTLNLATFTGNATTTVGKWPFAAAEQRVWLRLEGQTGSGGVYSITLLDGAVLTSAQATNGLSESVPRTELEKLGQDTRLEVICNVAFDRTASESTAVQFPRTAYTFKLHHDWVNPQIVSVSDSKGEVVDGGTTFDTTVSISGTSTVETELEILDGGTRLSTVTANSSGVWSGSLPGLTVKTYSLKASALDGSGMVSPPRRFDVVANLTPTITQVLDSNGPISNGGSTVETSVTVSGQGSPDQQIELFDGNTSKGTARTNNAGTWSLTVSGLTIASHPLKAKALYGTEPESTVWTVIVAVAVTPTITSIKDSKNVEIPPDGFTVDTDVVVTGSASANLQVEVFDGAATLGKVSANGAGQWTLPLTGLNVAVHRIKAKGDYASYPESPVRNFTITALVTPTITQVVEPDGTPVSNGGSTYANTVTASGKASIGQSVEVFDGASSKGTASVNTSGDWSRSVSGLSVGAHSLTAKALYASHPVSPPWTFNVQAATAPTLSVRDSKGEINQGGTTTETTVTASGTAAPNEQVEVFDENTSKGKTAVGGNGNWSLSVGAALGSHRLKAVGQYAENPASGVRQFSVISPIPDFVLDPSSVSLNGGLWGLAGYPGYEPLNWPAGTTYRRTPTSGVAPYTYSSSNGSIVLVDSTGFIKSVSNGTATITVQDQQGRRGSYTVTVSNVVMVHGLGNLFWAGAKSAASAAGLSMMNMSQLRQIYSMYGSKFPMGNFSYWSTDSAGLISNRTKNMVTGAEGTGYITYPGGSCGVIAI
ncbi:Ig-like domain-containing protein [Pseudomonas graminis]|uniref:Ig-like domain-containing protein n=1 Tax=Pseudomonas graminis TaxID=158627 RepID=UPI003C142428